jgi:hypothetical protein
MARAFAGLKEGGLYLQHKLADVLRDADELVEERQCGDIKPQLAADASSLLRSRTVNELVVAFLELWLEL